MFSSGLQTGTDADCADYHQDPTAAVGYSFGVLAVFLFIALPFIFLSGALAA